MCHRLACSPCLGFEEEAMRLIFLLKTRNQSLSLMLGWLLGTQIETLQPFLCQSHMISHSHLCFLSLLSPLLPLRHYYHG